MNMQLLTKILSYFPQKSAHSLLYMFTHHGKRMHFSNPETYDEWVHYHIIHTYGKEYAKYADKYKVRAFVKECGLSNILIPLLGGPYKKFSDIDFSELPNEFILKTNHASGPNHYYICNDKKEIDKKRIKEQFDQALEEDFSKFGLEYHYHYIEPCIVCEELLHDGNEKMTDYKVVCSYGKPLAILVCTERNKGRDYYSDKWEYLDYVKEVYRSKQKAKKPECFDAMIEAASIISKTFPVARVDFYVCSEKLYFGEITLTPSCGCTTYLNEKGQIEIGKMISNRIYEVRNQIHSQK